LYAGTGTIGILLADLFEKVYSVEIVPDASMDATKNAGINGLSDTFEAVNAPVEQFLEKFLASG
jgi:tRNA/tmRNA/rRNA uracil-C5-methylase (TrmA/RlmC/RlmD family)